MNPIIGRGIAAGGGVLTLISMFLPWFKFEDGSTNLWKATPRADIALCIIAVAVVGLAIAGMLAQLRILDVLLAVLSAAAFGFTLSYAIDYNADFGGWGELVSPIGPALSLAGALLAVLLTPAVTSGGQAMPAPSGAPAPDDLAPPPPQAVTPPAGWYTDPSGQASERYWSGSAWTGQIR